MAWDRATGTVSNYASPQRQDYTSTTTTAPSSIESSSTTSGTSTSSTDKTFNETVNTTNMDPASLAALKLLIQQLIGGGTQDLAQQKAQRQQEIQALQGQRSGFTKEAALADAQGAMGAMLRRALESALPTLVRSAEGAGTSANSMRALMTNDLATRAAEQAAALGLQNIGTYGGLTANLSSVLERLINAQDPVSAALLQALNISKGAVTNTNRSGSEQSNTVATQNSTTNSTQNNSGQQVTQSVDYANSGFGGSGDFYSPSGGSFSASGANANNNLSLEALQSYNRSTPSQDLQDLVSNDSWSGYTDF